MNAPAAMPQPQKPIRDAKGKRPQFYESPGLDQAMSMILVLASEFSAMRERVDTLERVLEQNGIEAGAAVEAYQPTPEVLTAREQWRQAFLGRLYYLARKDAADAARGDTEARFRDTIESIAES
ncbi:MAG: hypothetical protein ACK4MX_06565 [Thermaurantiacus sp.]